MAILQLRLRPLRISDHGQHRRQTGPPDGSIERVGRTIRPWHRLFELHPGQPTGDSRHGPGHFAEGRLHSLNPLSAHVLLHMGNIPHPHALSRVLQWPHRRPPDRLRGHDPLRHLRSGDLARPPRGHTRLPPRPPRQSGRHRHLDSPAADIPPHRPPPRMHLQRLPGPQTAIPPLSPHAARMDPLGHLHRLRGGVALFAIQYPHGGEPSHAVLSHDELCVWPDDDEGDLGAFDETAVSVLDGYVGAACGGGSVGESAAVGVGGS